MILGLCPRSHRKPDGSSPPPAGPPPTDILRPMRPFTIGSVCATLFLVTACAASEPGPDPSRTADPTSVATPGEGALTPGFDQESGQEFPADSALAPVDITRLLRVKATDAGTSASCVPADVWAAVENLDAAAGHRYGRLVLTNTSRSSCSVKGFPGIGARGERGNTFQIAAEQHEPRKGAATPRRVMLRPGMAAYANIEWTGELAGAESEKISMLAIQLTRKQDAFGIPAVGAVAADSGGQSGESVPLDIGMLTTVRIGPMQQAMP